VFPPIQTLGRWRPDEPDRSGIPHPTFQHSAQHRIRPTRAMGVCAARLNIFFVSGVSETIDLLDEDASPGCLTDKTMETLFHPRPVVLPIPSRVGH